MYVSIVATALILDAAFLALGLTPESGRAVEDVVRFAIDYTFWLNLAALAVTAAMVRLFVLDRRAHGAMHHDMPGDGPVKRGAAGVAGALLAAGAAAWAATSPAL
jgi:hypothetical protein